MADMAKGRKKKRKREHGPPGGYPGMVEGDVYAAEATVVARTGRPIPTTIIDQAEMDRRNAALKARGAPPPDPYLDVRTQPP